MPKRISETEKQIIRENLKKAALESIQNVGMQHTTVDELVKTVHIPKGTFYLFYESKEMLFLDALIKSKDRIQSILLSMLKKIDTEKDIQPQLVKILVTYFMNGFTDLPVYILSTKDIAYLQEKLSKEALPDFYGDVTNNFMTALSLLPIANKKNLKKTAESLQILFFSYHNSDLAPFYKKSQAKTFLTLTISGIVSPLF